MTSSQRILECATATVRRSAWIGVASLALSACYAQLPLTSRPEPGAYLVVDLNDAGRVEMAPQIGPSVGRIEGQLDSWSDSQFVLRVAKVSTLRGAPSLWTGEPVTLRSGYTYAMVERRLSKGRTAVLAGTLVTAAGVFVFTRGLGILGGEGGDRTGGSDGGTTPISRLGHP